MARYEITGPDGHRYEVTAPDHVSQDDVLRYAAGQIQGVHQQALESAGFDAEGNLRDKATGTGSLLQNLAGGYVHSFVAGKQGLQQLARKPYPLGFGGAADYLGVPSDAELQKQIDETKQQDAALLSTGGGFVGNAVGMAGQALAGGAALRGASAPSVAAMLTNPATYGQAAAGGAALGFVQPVAGDESRLGNTALGAAGGVGGRAVGGLIGAVARGVGAAGRAIADKFGGRTGADRRVAETVRTFMQDPAALQALEQSEIPGVARTSAEAMNDNGLYQLERSVAARDPQFASALASQRTANNAARVAALQDIAGDASKMDAAQAARQAAAMPMLEKAVAKDGVNTAPVVALIDQLMSGPSGKRDAVAAALGSVRAKLAAGDTDVGSLYGIRQHIGDLMSGRLSGDQAGAKLARKELIQVRGMLDNQISEVAPEFTGYLREFADKSLPINQMQVGQKLLSSGTGPALDQLGNPVLSPAKYGQQMKGLDRVASKATGFKQAKIDSVMTPEQLATMNAVGQDLSRQNLAMSAAKVPGSPTAQYQAGQNILDQMLGPLGVPDGAASMLIPHKLGVAMNLVGKFFKNDPDRLRQALLDPEQLKRIMTSIPPDQRPQLAELVKAMATYAGAPAGAAASVQASQ